MPDEPFQIHYDITGFDRLKKPGTYHVNVSLVLPREDGGLTVYGSVVTPREATDDELEAVKELDGLLMRPLFVNRRAAARLTTPETRPGQHMSAETQRRRSATEVLDLVTEWYEQHHKTLKNRSET